MKYVIYALAAVAGVVQLGGTAYTIYALRQQAGETREFSAPDSQYVGDLAGKSMVIPATGQVWPFAADQNLSFKVVEKKAAGDAVVVVGYLTASASMAARTDDVKERPSGAGSAAPARQPAVTTTTLEGVVKLTYESVGKEWFLVAVEAVSVKVTTR